MLIERERERERKKERDRERHRERESLLARKILVYLYPSYIIFCYRYMYKNI